MLPVITVVICVIAALVVGLLIGAVIGISYRKRVAEAKIGSAEIEATRLIN